MQTVVREVECGALERSSKRFRAVFARGGMCAIERTVSWGRCRHLALRPPPCGWSDLDRLPPSRSVPAARRDLLAALVLSIACPTYHARIPPHTRATIRHKRPRSPTEQALK